MICQFAWKINTLTEVFWRVSLEELYDMVSKAVRYHRTRFYIPSSECYCRADDYILYGSYSRSRIIDIQEFWGNDNRWHYREVEIQDFRIQRILDKATGRTHAILPEIFVPYRQYSLRYILFHLRHFYGSFVTQEAYCLEVGIDIKIFKGWLKWFRNYITVLANLGLTKNYQDNWHILGQWIKAMSQDILGWTYKSLKKLNLGMFQDHQMPENTMYRNYERSG